MKFEIGDKVRCGEHISVIKDIRNGWYILETKVPSHCCNYYAGYQLELVK